MDRRLINHNFATAISGGKRGMARRLRGGFGMVRSTLPLASGEGCVPNQLAVRAPAGSGRLWSLART